MNLSEYLKSIGESPSTWGQKHKIPGPRLHDHCKNENGSKESRRLGPNLALKVVIASNGHVKLSDLLPDMANKIEQAQELEANA